MKRRSLALEVIEGLHEASLDPSAWSNVLAALSQYFDQSLVTIVPLDAPSALMASLGHKEALSAYKFYWWKHDIINEAALSQINPLGIVCDWELVDPEKIALSGFYNEFRKSHGLGHYIGYCGEISRDVRFSVGVQMPLGKGVASLSAARKDIAVLGQHVGRALAINARIREAREQQHSLADTLLRMTDGLVICNDDGHVAFANETVLNGLRDVLKIASGQIQPVRASDQSSFALFLSNAARNERSDPGKAVFLIKRQNASPVLLRAALLPRSAEQSGWKDPGGRRLILIVIVDLGTVAEAKSEKLLEAVGLTPGEARIAALVGIGQSPIQVAQKLGLSEGTVRTRLKHIFPKLGISRQGQLVHLVTRMCYPHAK